MQRIPRKEKDESEESGWSERTTGTKRMTGDKSSERRKIKAKNCMPSRLVSRDVTVQVLSRGAFLCPCVLSHLNVQTPLSDANLSKCKQLFSNKNVDRNHVQPVIM